MRKSLLFTLNVVLALNICSSVSGQISPSETRRFNLAVLNVIDEYERTMSLSERKDGDDFVGLFYDTTSLCVFNDILGTANFQKSLTPSEYVNNILNNKNSLLTASIRDVRKEGDIYEIDGILHRKVSFSKYILFIDGSVYSGGEGGVLFDSSQAFKDSPDFRLVADFVFNPKSGVCLISSISALESKEPSPLDENKFSIIVGSSEKYDKQLVTRGEHLLFNDFNQSLSYYNDFEIDNPDVYAEPIVYASGERYNILGFKFRPMRFRAKIYGDIAAGKSFSISSSEKSFGYSAKSYEFGADLGFETSVGNHVRLGFYSGAGISMSDILFNVSNIVYTLPYISRSYNFSATEKLSLTDIVIPLYLEMEIDVIRRVVLDLDLGAKAYLNRATKLGPYTVTGTFGNNQIRSEYNSFIDPVNYTRASYDISLFAKAEIDYCIINRLLYAFVSYGYEQGLKASYDSGKQIYFSPNVNIYPFYYSPLTNQDVPFHSIIGSVIYQRAGNWISAGVKFKF